MTEDVRALVDQYVNWIKNKTTFKQVDDWTEITTPFLDRHNDYLQIYAKKQDGSYVLTDDGYIVQDLKSSGCSLSSKHRKELLAVTLNGFGIDLSGDALTTTASEAEFPQRKHNLVQAMLAVNDLFYLAEPHIASLFLEDVTAWLDSNRVRYIPGVKFTGKSTYDHYFDFVIPRSDEYPERFIQTVNSPRKDSAERVAFAWIDVKETRPDEAMAYAFVNDTKKEMPSETLTALGNYGITAVPWES